MRAAIYGMGNIGLFAYKALEKRKITQPSLEIVYFVRTRKAKDLFCGIEVRAVDEISFSDFDILIIASDPHYSEIIETINNVCGGYDLHREQIIKYDAFFAEELKELGELEQQELKRDGMRFSQKDLDCMSNKIFPELYRLELPNRPIVCRRETRLLAAVEGKSCMHIGCCDHLPVIEAKVRQKTWLHGLLEEHCKDVLGIDINEKAVAYVNEMGFAASQVYCADVTAPDFTDRIPRKTLDYVVLGEIVEHVDNPVLFLSGLRENMVKYGFHGRYIITVPNAFAMMREESVYWDGVEKINSDHRYWFTPYTIAKVMTLAGIQPEELFFANDERYPVEKGFQSDRLVIIGK